MYKKVVAGGFEPNTCGLQNPGDTQHIYIIQLTILQHEVVLKSACLGQFKEKGKNSNYWVEYFPVAIFFSTENKNDIFLFSVKKTSSRTAKTWLQTSILQLDQLCSRKSLPIEVSLSMASFTSRGEKGWSFTQFSLE